MWNWVLHCHGAFQMWAGRFTFDVTLTPHEVCEQRKSKGRTIRKLMGARSSQKNSRKGKLNEKNSCTPINPKKYSRYGLKKIHTRNLITKKNSCGSKIPPPPHNFSNGRSLKVTKFYFRCEPDVSPLTSLWHHAKFRKMLKTVAYKMGSFWIYNVNQL